MRASAFIILFLSLISISSNSQDPHLFDSTIHTFTVKAGYNEICNNNDASKFEVVNNRTQFEPTPRIYIANNDIFPIKIDTTALYTISGYLVTKKEWVYGCNSRRWEEIRTYIIPARSNLFFKRKFSPHSHY